MHQTFMHGSLSFRINALLDNAADVYSWVLQYASRNSFYQEASILMAKKKARELILCACGCGGTLISVDAKGRGRRYITNHQTRTIVLHRKRPYGPSPTKGKKASLETRERLRQSHLGQEGYWKGKKLPYAVWNKGTKGLVHISLETRRRISAKLKGEQSYLWRGGIARCPRVSTMEWRELRRQIYARDQWACQVCRRHCPNRIIACHHIIPVRCGGSDDPSNLVTLCNSCHSTQEQLYGQSSYFWAECLTSLG